MVHVREEERRGGADTALKTKTQRVNVRKKSNAQREREAVGLVNAGSSYKLETALLALQVDLASEPTNRQEGPQQKEDVRKTHRGEWANESTGNLLGQPEQWHKVRWRWVVQRGITW